MYKLKLLILIEQIIWISLVDNLFRYDHIWQNNLLFLPFFSLFNVLNIYACILYFSTFSSSFFINFFLLFRYLYYKALLFNFLLFL